MITQCQIQNAVKRWGLLGREIILFQEQTYEPEQCWIIFVYRVVLGWPNKCNGTNDFALVIIFTMEHQHGIVASSMYGIIFLFSIITVFSVSRLTLSIHVQLITSNSYEAHHHITHPISIVYNGRDTFLHEPPYNQGFERIS